MLECYRRCAEELPAARFAKEKKRLLKVVRERSLTAYLDICVEEGRTKEVLETITESKGLPAWSKPDAGHRYSAQLEPLYPKEVAGFYWDEAQRLAGAGGRDSYRACVSLLNRIRPLMQDNGMADQWTRSYALFLGRRVFMLSRPGRTGRVRFA